MTYGAAIIVALFVAATSLRAQTITFETLPDGSTPTDGMQISTQYQASFGVSFSLEGGGFPVIAKVGAPTTAFLGPPDSTAPDQPASQHLAKVGSFFLTDDGRIDTVPKPLLISYTTPVRQASGMILDIDSPEQWRVEARDATNALLESVILTPDSYDAGDGGVTPWAFTRSTADISLIRISYIGSGSIVGLGFDNFSPSSALPAGPATLEVHFYPGLTITGTVGAAYRIDYSETLATENWIPLSTIVLPSSPYTFSDFTAINSPRRFYRAVGLPQTNIAEGADGKTPESPQSPH